MHQRFRKGDTLFRAGDASKYAYLLVAGAAQVANGAIHSVESGDVMAPGEFIGEIGVLLGTPRTATVVFTTDSIVQLYDRRAFLDLITVDAVLSMRLLHTLSLRTRTLVDRLALLPDRRTTKPVVVAPTLALNAIRTAFDGLMSFIRNQTKALPPRFHTDTRYEVDGFERRVYPKGSILHQEGDESEFVLLIESGIVRTTKRIGGRDWPVGRVRAGEFLGEIGVLESLPRNSTARASTDVVARVISLPDFYWLMQTSPKAYLSAIDSLSERARRLARKLKQLAPPETLNADEKRTLQEIVGTIESAAQLAEHRLADELKSLRQFFNAQVGNGREMVVIYEKYLRGEATKEEMERANAYFRDYLKLAGIGTLLILPGAPITIPLVAKAGKALGIEVFPSRPNRSPRPRRKNRELG